MTDPTFALRGTSLRAWRSQNGSRPGYPVKSPAVNPVLLSSSGLTGAFGATVIDVSNPTFGGYRGITYPGNTNLDFSATAITVLMRIVPNFTGFCPQNQTLWQFAGSSASQLSWMFLCLDNDGTINFQCWSAAGNQTTSSVSAATLSCVAGHALDIQLSWDGTSGSKVFISVNGVLFDTLIAGAPMTNIAANIDSIMLGTGFDVPQNNFYIDEFLFFATNLSPTYTARSAYWNTAAYDPSLSTDPGIANVAAGVNYEINGTALTGTLGASTDPGVGNVVSGIAYEINGATKVGTLTGFGSIDPGVQNVTAGTFYEINGASLTGALAVDNKALVLNLRARLALPDGGKNLEGRIAENETGRKLAVRLARSNNLAAKLSTSGTGVSGSVAPFSEVDGGGAATTYSTILSGGTAGRTS